MRFVVAAALFATACAERQEPVPRVHQAPPAGGSNDKHIVNSRFGFDVKRADFNRLAVQLDLPVYWTADADGDGGIGPSEVASLLFYPTHGDWITYMSGSGPTSFPGGFTPAFTAAYNQIVTALHEPPITDARRKLVRADLEQGRPTLVASDFTQRAPADKKFVAQMLIVADLIDKLYAIQDGTAVLAGQLPSDSESRSAFRRNRGPKCVGPKTENEAACSAIPGAPKPEVTVYPTSVTNVAQTDPGFCAALEKAADPKVLSPFTTVRLVNGKLVAVPFTEAYKDLMAPISKALSDAAFTAGGDPNEKPLEAYLNAAAKSFLDNNWDPADEAWAKMTVDNSKWYVRVGPDETYWEPCAHKAGFHLTFAAINTGSKAWQKALTPVQQDMEELIAKHAGPPYKSRKVTFHLPDFIDIIVNAGDDRTPLGATIGQSLPNWGPVANQGRGRTVAMVNLYLDPDSKEARKQQAESLLDAASMTGYSGAPEASLLNTILHEATHNLGPAHEYKVAGKADGQVFSGPIASVLEELKAQTGALFLVDFVRTRIKAIDDKMALEVYSDGIVWAFGHISQGMYSGTKSRKAYGNLAAIQIGFLIEKGALTWDDKATAANGHDKGAFTVHADKLIPAIDELMTVVAGIKARGDTKLAAELFAKYVDSDKIVPHGKIAERFLRFPKASFVYAVAM